MARVEGCALEDVFGLARDGFALVVVEENFQFAKFDVGDVVESVGIEGSGALLAQRFERVRRAMGEVIEPATEVEAELLDIKFALTLGAGVDANLIQCRAEYTTTSSRSGR